MAASATVMNAGAISGLVDIWISRIHESVHGFYDIVKHKIVAENMLRYLRKRRVFLNDGGGLKFNF